MTSIWASMYFKFFVRTTNWRFSIVLNFLNWKWFGFCRAFQCFARQLDYWLLLCLITFIRVWFPEEETWKQFYHFYWITCSLLFTLYNTRTIQHNAFNQLLHKSGILTQEKCSVAGKRIRFFSLTRKAPVIEMLSEIIGYRKVWIITLTHQEWLIHHKGYPLSFFRLLEIFPQNLKFNKYFMFEDIVWIVLLEITVHGVSINIQTL